MLRGIFFVGALVLVLFSLLVIPPFSNKPGEQLSAASHADSLFSRFSALDISEKLSFEVYCSALEGMKKFHFKNDSVVTIIDYSRASTEKRLFVIDLAQNKLLFESLVAHGRNSGMNYATVFSNELQSLKSSPGFFATAETYQGSQGYSLRLDGLEKGVNDLARERAIVIHAANYVSEQFAKSNGRLGRSWGCPALPVNLNKAIIDCIKDGSCLYIYTNSSTAQLQFQR